MFAADTTIISFPGLGIDTFEIPRFVTQNLFGKGISIAWYGVIVCAAMLCAFFVVQRNAKKYESISMDSVLDYFIFCIPLGFIGARAMYVLTNLDYYKTFSEAIAIWNGGIAIYGGILTGAVVILVVSKIKKISALKAFDAIAPGLLLAQAIGRWGNFVNGEAHGGVTSLPWRMMINGEGPFHPTFLYESLITLTGFCIVTFFLYRRKKFDGEILCFYLIWYGIGRTLVEGLRTDSLYFGSLRASQCIGVATALFGILFLILSLVQLKQKKEAALPEVGEETSAEESEEKSEEKAEEKTAENEKEIPKGE